MKTIILLSLSNIFKTFAWYAHHKDLRDKPWIIVLTVFLLFALYYMKEPLRVDYLWAGLCLVGAACFMFRAPASGGA